MLSECSGGAPRPLGLEMNLKKTGFHLGIVQGSAARQEPGQLGRGPCLHNRPSVGHATPGRLASLRARMNGPPHWAASPVYEVLSGL